MAKSLALSPWCGWDQSNLPWSQVKHQDAVCRAVFGPTWAMEDAHTLISFIERTWSAPPAHRTSSRFVHHEPGEFGEGATVCTGDGHG